MVGHVCTVQKMEKDLQAQDRKKSARKSEPIQSRVASMEVKIDRLSEKVGGGDAETQDSADTSSAFDALSDPSDFSFESQ